MLIILFVDRLLGVIILDLPVCSKAVVTSAGIRFPFRGWRVFPTNYIKERKKQWMQD